MLAEFFGRILISAEVHDEVTVAGRGLPGAEEVQSAAWIEVQETPATRDPSVAPSDWAKALAGLGAGERSAILLAKALPAHLLLLDEWKARRIAQSAGLPVAGCNAILEDGARMGRIPDLRLVYIDLLKQGIRFDLQLLRSSLARLGFPEL